MASSPTEIATNNDLRQSESEETSIGGRRIGRYDLRNEDWHCDECGTKNPNCGHPHVLTSGELGQVGQLEKPLDGMGADAQLKSQMIITGIENIQHSMRIMLKNLRNIIRYCIYYYLWSRYPTCHPSCHQFTVTKQMSPEVENEIKHYLADRVSDAGKREYQNLLGIKTVKLGSDEYNAKVIDKIQELLPAYRDLFDRKNTEANSTIGSHSLEVMHTFDDEGKHYALTSGERTQLVRSGISNLEGLMKTTLALHDIGKGIALEKSEREGRRSSEMQHIYTIPLLEHAMRELGYSLREVKLAYCLVSEDPLGGLVNGRIDLKQSASLVKSLSIMSNVPPPAFYKVLTNFWIADATFYKDYCGRTLKRDESTKKYVPQNSGRFTDWQCLEATILDAPVQRAIRCTIL